MSHNNPVSSEMKNLNIHDIKVGFNDQNKISVKSSLVASGSSKLWLTINQKLIL